MLVTYPLCHAQCSVVTSFSDTEMHCSFQANPSGVGKMCHVRLQVCCWLGKIDIGRRPSASFLQVILQAKNRHSLARSLRISLRHSGPRGLLSARLYLVSPSLVVPWARSQTNETRKRDRNGLRASLRQCFSAPLTLVENGTRDTPFSNISK